MRKLCIFSVILCGLLAACSFVPLEEKSPWPKLTPGSYQPVTQAGQAYKNMLALRVELVTASVEKIFEYDPELINQRSSRSLLGGKSVDFMELLSQTDLMKTRSGNSRSLSGEELTLYEELEALAEEYQQALKEFYIDDLSFLNGVNGYSVRDRQVIWDGDMVIPADSVEGTIQLYLLKSQLSGEDVSAIINDMNMVFANYAGERDSSRGLYRHSTPLWQDRTIYYNGAIGFCLPIVKTYLLTR